MSTVARSFPHLQKSKWKDPQTRTLWSSTARASGLPFSLKPLGKQDTVEHRPLRMIMFGKPGAGKGTLSARLTQKYDISFLSTGDLLRQEIAENTETGKTAENIVASGGLLPDDMMIKMISGKLDMLRDKPWILDGFPRTLGQGELLDSHLRNVGKPISLIVNLNVPDEVILNRISDRWVHLPSGRVYNLSYNRPRVEGRDDITGEPLTKRPDDNPEIFARRLKKFYELTSPLISYFSTRASPGTRLVTLAGNTSDEIWPKLEEIVKTFHIRPRVEHREQERAQSLREAVSQNICQERESDRLKLKIKPDTSPR